MPFGLLDVLEKYCLQLSREGKEDFIILLDETKQVFIASANSSAELNTELPIGKSLPSSKGPFSLRLLSLPKPIVEQIRSGREEVNNNISPNQINEDLVDNNDDKSIQFPARSILNLRGEDPQKTLQVITGIGALEESLACFRMLSELMGLPFRRDALEKTIRDACAVKTPNTVLGNLAGMGPRIRDKGSSAVYKDECAMLDQLDDCLL